MPKLVVTALRRYWALGRCFDAGETEVDVDEALLPSVLAQLDAARGGPMKHDHGFYRGMDSMAPTSPCVLSYRIVADPPPAPAPEPAPARVYHQPSSIEASERLRDALTPPDAPPEPEVMHDPSANAED